MQAGTIVGGRFDVEHEAGAGGMGTIYRAMDRVTGARARMLLAQKIYEEAGALRHAAHCILSSAYGALLLGDFTQAESSRVW
jgi:hypothetical protein